MFKTHFGTVVIIGSPNVGKSTLMNQLLKQKISITSSKPNTTSNFISGVYTDDIYQIIYIDTPGIFFKNKYKINKILDFTNLNYINNISLIILVVESTCFTLNDKLLINQLSKLIYPVILIINKIDLLIKKELLHYINFVNKIYKFYKIIPISAYNNKDINLIYLNICKIIPKGCHIFLKNYITNHKKYFIISEIIREKLFRFLGNELPYSFLINIENILIKYNILFVHCLIFVNNINKKKIIIGKNGNKIKLIIKQSEYSIKSIFNINVNVNIIIKIKLN